MDASHLHIGFVGFAECRVDSKGRFLFPAQFSERLVEPFQDKVVLNRGEKGEKNLRIWAMDEWVRVTKKLSTLNRANPDIRKFIRDFYAGATVVKLDSAKRILIPKVMLEHAGIKKDIVLEGVGKIIEVWSKKEWDRRAKHDDDYSPDFVPPNMYE